MELPGGEAFEYLLAEFGVKVPSRELRLGSSHPSSRCLTCESGCCPVHRTPNEAHAVPRNVVGTHTSGARATRWHGHSH